MSTRHFYGRRIHSVRLIAAASATLLTLGLFALVDSPQSHAADIGTRTVIVQYRDLNLSTEEGAAALERRVAGAVQSVCKGLSGRTVLDFRREADCRETASAMAEPQLQAALASVGRTAQFASIQPVLSVSAAQ
jgi:UrcA family protein